MEAAIVIGAIVLGYLLGSVLPADLLARSRGVDIRAVGTGNPGTTNAWEQLGHWEGAVTGAYDSTKGLVAMGLAARLGVTPPWMYAAGIAAVIGHRYPLWSGFRGGNGTATSTGLALYTLGLCLADGWVATTTFAAIVLIAGIVFGVTRHGSVVGALVLPLVVGSILLGSAPASLKLFSLLMFGFVWVIQVQLQLAKRRMSAHDRALDSPHHP
jgi:glycerol-3-phosphate acyltransferase PlsY